MNVLSGFNCCFLNSLHHIKLYFMPIRDLWINMQTVLVLIVTIITVRVKIGVNSSDPKRIIFLKIPRGDQFLSSICSIIENIVWYTG